MNIKDMTIRLFCLVWIFALLTNVAFAQNYGGVVSVESERQLSGSASIDDFVDVSMVEINESQNAIPNINLQEGAIRYSEESSDYTLGKDDIIQVSVLRHPEVSGEYIINQEGKIQYEFIGDITVEGLKKDEVKQHLESRLSEYIISPDVTVKIIGYNSKIVYVVGEVGSPGKIFMRGDTITVREALVQADLPLLTGKLKQARLITPSDTGKVDRKIVDVHKLLYEGDLRQNLVMKPGDTLYIPPTTMAKAMRVIQPVTQPINTAGSTGRRIYTGGF